MQNLLILYNPYYQEDVIEQHLKVLMENKKVAFAESLVKIWLDLYLKINIKKVTFQQVELMFY